MSRTEEFDIQDLLKIAQTELDKSEEQYYSTSNESFQNGIALGKLRAYKNIAGHIEDNFSVDMDTDQESSR